MKKICWLFLLSVFFLSCNNNSRNISEPAQKYLEAMGNWKLEEAKPYATQETSSGYIDIFLYKTILPNLDSNYIKTNTPASITIDAVKQTSDTTADVSFTKTSPVDEVNGTLHMVKRENKWLAQVLVAVPEILNEPDTTFSDDLKNARKVSK